MRKEYNIKDVPFSENLVFYAPLTQGDLTDHISGNTGYAINASTNNLVWSVENEAYRLHTESNYTNAIVFDTPNLKSLWNNSTSFTWSVVIKKIQTATYQFIIGYSKSGDSSFTYGYSLNHLYSYQSYISSTQFDRFTQTFDGNIIRIYKNLNQIGTSFLSATWMGNPINWKEDYYVHISLASAIGGNFKTDCYMKDARLYNRALSASEVAQL